ncbi:MAG: hypothetical protein JWQ45_2705 [Blastococcus sp.]|jgi:hypothetical protein|nr:hypothetical protein [Blastococcus sp.]
MLYPLSYGGSSARNRPGYTPRLAGGLGHPARTAGTRLLRIPMKSRDN